MITPSVPGAADDPWSTPARPAPPVVSGIVPTHETPETPDPIVSPGIAGAKADDVSASVAAAVTAAEARFASHQQDTYDQGSQIGVPLDLPPVPGASSKHTGPI